MSSVWTAVKKSLNCKSDSSDVYQPKPKRKNRSRSRNSCCKPKPATAIATTASSSCKSGLDGVINASKRLKEKPTNNSSPLSIRSSDLINPYTHHVRFNSEFNIPKDHYHGPGSGSPFLAPYSPGLRLSQSFNGGLDSLPRTGSRSRPNQVSGSSFHRRLSVVETDPGSSFRRRLSLAEMGGGGSFRPATCHKCGELLTRQDAEAHYLSKHAVTEVLEGDSSRKIIEMIFMAGWTNSEHQGRIERVLKVHNPQTKLAQFEEYREMVKIRANRLQYSKKHPRCLADGNELLRFYGTTLACPLGQNGSSSLCNLQRCNVCCILRHGFSSEQGMDHSILGIFTTSTCERAYGSIEIIEGEEGQHRNKAPRRALIVCRVIAGRVHKPIAENFQELVGGRRSGFDSLAGKMGGNNSHVEELYLLNPTALLPCFVIVCK